MNLGVASKANLMLVEYQTGAITAGILGITGSRKGLFQQRQVTPMALVDVFKFILEDVKKKRLQEKAVVNLSAGMLYVKEMARSVKLTSWQDFRQGKAWIKWDSNTRSLEICCHCWKNAT